MIAHVVAARLCEPQALLIGRCSVGGCLRGGEWTAYDAIQRNRWCRLGAGSEYLFERVINKLMHGATVAEAHFGFGRVDVHVYQRRINRQEQAAARLAATV